MNITHYTDLLLQDGIVVGDVIDQLLERTLYHGTLRDHEHSIRLFGVVENHILYHGTPNEFDQFREPDEHSIGHHFGTPSAAWQRTAVGYRGEDTDPRDHDSRMLKARVHVRNPVRVNDGDFNHPRAMMKHAPLKNLPAHEKSELRTMGDVRRKLKSLGHDGLVYTNNVEDAGSDSYVAFHPHQVEVLKSTPIHDDEKVTFDDHDDWADEVKGDNEYFHDRYGHHAYSVANRLESINTTFTQLVEDTELPRALKKAGLPPDLNIHPQSLVRRLLLSDRYNVKSTRREGQRGWVDAHVVEFHPKLDGEWGKHIKKTQRRKFGEPEHYDSRIAHVVPHEDTGEPVVRLKPNSGYSEHFPEEKEAGYLYRGMSSEEWKKAKKRGYIESNREYNLSGQENITSFSDSPHTAAHYASGFAPPQHSPTFHKPAYVVKVRHPDSARLERGSSNYYEVPGRIPMSAVHSVFAGRTFSQSPGSMELVRDRYRNDAQHVDGSGIHPSSRVGWKRIK